jgi:hypothetical protein
VRLAQANDVVDKNIHRTHLPEENYTFPTPHPETPPAVEPMAAGTQHDKQLPEFHGVSGERVLTAPKSSGF